MKSLFPLVLILGVVVFSGCKSGGPVNDYTEFVNAEFERLVEIQKKLNIPELVLDSEYTLDVQETDSLVSPLLGTCVVDASATYDENESWSVVVEYRLNLTHAYQDEKWVLTACTVDIIDGEVIDGDVGDGHLEEWLAQRTLPPAESLFEIAAMLEIYANYWNAN